MRRLRLLLVVLYVGYLVQVGLLMILLPWSEAWPVLLLRVPPGLLEVLDNPATRGAISGVGVLHLLLLAFELGLARPMRRPPSATWTARRPASLDAAGAQPYTRPDGGTDPDRR